MRVYHNEHGICENLSRTHLLKNGSQLVHGSGFRGVALSYSLEDLQLLEQGRIGVEDPKIVATTTTATARIMGR